LCLLPVEMLANQLSQEEIDYGVQLTLIFLRHPPYADGGSDGALAAAAMRTRTHLMARRIGYRRSALCYLSLSRHRPLTPSEKVTFSVHP